MTSGYVGEGLAKLAKTAREACQKSHLPTHPPAKVAKVAKLPPPQSSIRVEENVAQDISTPGPHPGALESQQLGCVTANPDHFDRNPIDQLAALEHFTQFIYHPYTLLRRGTPPLPPFIPTAWVYATAWGQWWEIVGIKNGTKPKTGARVHDQRTIRGAKGHASIGEAQNAAG